MRLLNTATLTLEDFMVDPPPYAILSHTWGKGEVLFKDIEDGKAYAKKGYRKVRGFCGLAASEGFRYCWIDTCCIDKSSSAELSEAINSMFMLYRKSQRCYVYLDIEIDGRFMTSDELRQSRWVTRGWTLQELIAPVEVCFYDERWKFCGDRHDLIDQLQSVTGIDQRVLLQRPDDPLDLEDYSIATRMSWASRRRTTRPEDIAYCLFGVFQVHLPPLYGEGRVAAFKRLQEEIIKKSLDLSVLAWRAKCGDSLLNEITSGLAKGPEAFDGLLMDVRGPSAVEVEPFHLTNKGLRLTLPLTKVPTEERGIGFALYSEHIMFLPNCKMPTHSRRSYAGVRIWRLGACDIYYRATFPEHEKNVSYYTQLEYERANVQTFYLATHIPNED